MPCPRPCYATQCERSDLQEKAEDGDRAVSSMEAEAERPIRLTKLVTYHGSLTVSGDEQLERPRRVPDGAARRGFDHLIRDQRRCVDKYWQRADIGVHGARLRARQCLRWDLFQLLRATGRADGSGILAKAPTGAA